MPILRAADLKTQVYEDLSARIRSGEVDPEDKLTENFVCDLLGVSRTPVREALSALAREGLLEKMKRGFRLPRLSQKQLDEQTAVRQLLEPAAMRLVVENTPDAERKRLAARIRYEVEHHRNDDSFISAHARIRDAVLEYSGNSALNATIRQFDNFVTVIRVSTLKRQAWRDQSADGQLRKADLIEQGDPDEAELYQRRLIDMTYKAFSEFLRETEGRDADQGGR